VYIKLHFSLVIFLQAEAEDPANELLGFFKSFGFNLGK
jgi:hypothetical protein